MDAGKIKFILLKEIGNAYIDYDVTDEEMLAALKMLFYVIGNFNKTPYYIKILCDDDTHLHEALV